MPEFFMFIIFLFFVLAIIGAIIATYKIYYSNRAVRFGYTSRVEYLKAVPKTDEEKRDAVDQACKGVVICLLGLMFPPLLLVGLFPLFFGGRKILSVSMGLGSNDDGDQPQT